MAHVITEPCIGSKDASCLASCPVDCIHPARNEPGFAAATMLYIDPGECICCGICVDDCPVRAIFPEEDVPAEWTRYIQINLDYYKK
jgi:NAD-dependent dihydropyrimidine dehydrogenase PreA subunit